MYTIISANSNGVDNVHFAETKNAAKMTFIDAILNEIIKGLDNNDIIPGEPVILGCFFTEYKINQDDFYDKNNPYPSNDMRQNIVTEKLAAYIVNNDLIDAFTDFINEFDGWSMSDTVFTVSDKYNDANYIEVSLWRATEGRIRTEKYFE